MNDVFPEYKNHNWYQWSFIKYCEIEFSSVQLRAKNFNHLIIKVKTFQLPACVIVNSVELYLFIPSGLMTFTHEGHLGHQKQVIFLGKF